MHRLVWTLAAVLGLSGCESTPILLYHSIGEAFDSPRHVSTERFRQQMQWLKSEGYSVISARDLDQIEQGKMPRPHRPIALTFDDGYSNFYDNAFPILKEMNLAATMFIITSRTGDDESTRVIHPTRHMTWTEVQEIEAAGIDVESHSVTHPHLKGMPRELVEREVIDSKAELEARLGRSVTVFAYPNGSEDGAARELAKSAGYVSALSVSSGLDGPFDRQRISIHTDDDLASFVHKIGGSWWGKAGGERR